MDTAITTLDKMHMPDRTRAIMRDAIQSYERTYPTPFPVSSLSILHDQTVRFISGNGIHPTLTVNGFNPCRSG